MKKTKIKTKKNKTKQNKTKLESQTVSESTSCDQPVYKAATNSRSLDQPNLSLVSYCDRAFVTQCKNNVQTKFVVNMEHFNFITGPQYQLA